LEQQHLAGVRVARRKRGTPLAIKKMAPGPDKGQDLLWAEVSMKIGVRESAISFVIFGGVIFALASIDPNVRDRVTEVITGGGVARLGNHAGDLGGALWTAVRTQSIENAPMAVFAAVGVLLTLFMLRT
jgi:hypothetical protein